MSEQAIPSNTCNRRMVLPWIILFCLLLAQALYVRAFYAPALATPDDNGYWAQGSLIAREGRSWFIAASDVQYIGIHWLVTDDDRYVSRYPPGLALIVAMFYRLFGWEASVLVNPILATLTLLGLYLLARRLVGPWWGLAVCAIIAANPVFNQFALWCFSHMAVTFFLVWGILLLILWTEKRRWWLGFLAGLLLGFIPAIRYAETVFAIACATFLLMDAWHAAEGRKQLVFLVIGAIIPPALLALRNYQLFDSLFATAYALTEEQTGFGWSYFANHLIPEFRSLISDGMGPAFILGLLGMITMTCTRPQRRLGIFLLLLVVPLTLLYMAYYWGAARGPQGGDGGGGLRFFLPTFPCYALAGIWFLSETLKTSAMPLRIAAGATLCVIQIAWGSFHQHDEFSRLHLSKKLLADVTRKLETTVPPSALLLGNREVLDHLDFVREWKLADLGIIRGERGGPQFAGRRRNDSGPSPRQKEKGRKFIEKYGDMTVEERAITLAQEALEWAGSNKIYFVGADSDLAGLRRPFLPDDFTIVARIPVPKLPQQTNEPAQPRDAVMPMPPPGMDGARPPPDDRIPPAVGVGNRDNQPLVDGPGFAGPGRRDGIRRGRMGGGGPMGNRLLNAKEIVVAEWNRHIAKPRPPRDFDR